MALSGHISGWRRIFRRILGRPHSRARVRPAVSAITDIIIIYRTSRLPVELKIMRFEPGLRGLFAKPCMQASLLFNDRTNVMQRCCNSNATQHCTSTCTAYLTTTVANIATHLDYNYSRFCNKLVYTAVAICCLAYPNLRSPPQWRLCMVTVFENRKRLTSAQHQPCH